MFEEIEINTKINANINPKARAIVGGFNIQVGDILITNGTSSAGFLGHAAIADDNTTILDIPKIGETTRVLTHQKWIDDYSKKGWVKVYRIKDSTLARDAARWADYNYYSSTGSTVQNIRPTYGITLHLYDTNPTYCSKIVYQAYWYGTGSTSVMQAKTGIVTPYGLIECFNPTYKPTTPDKEY